MPAIKAYLNNIEDTGWSDNDAAWWGASGYHVKNYRFNADVGTSAGYYAMWELNHIFVTGDYSGGHYNYNVPPAQYFYDGVVLWNKAYTTILQTVQANQRVAPGSSIDLWTTDDKLWHFYFVIVSVPIIYTATFVYNDGSANATANYTYNTYNTFPTPSRTGYTFSGWATNPNIGTGTSLTWTYADNITFNAQWTGKTYTINYNANGGTGSTTSTSAVYPSNLSISSNGFTRTGYSFIGWATSENGSVAYNQRSTIAHPGTSAIIGLYAFWEIIRYTVTFEKRINDPPRTSYITPSYITQNYNTAVTFPTFKAIGYTFVRWVDANNNTYTTINNLTGDITLFAVWQKKETINFTELNRIYNGTRGSNPLPDRGALSISIGKFRAESGRGATEEIKLITDFKGKGL